MDGADRGDGGGGGDSRGGGGGDGASFGAGGPASVVPPASGVYAEASDASKEMHRLVQEAQRPFGESDGHPHAVADIPPSATTCTLKEQKDILAVQVTPGVGVEIG